jgi:hypothetical protein
MNKILSLLFLACFATNYCGKAHEYGLRMRAGIETVYDNCGGYQKGLFLGLGLGRYATIGSNYSYIPSMYSPSFSSYNRPYVPIFIPSSYGQSLYSSLGLYEHPSYYSPHSNMYDGSLRYNPYGLSYRPTWL